MATATALVARLDAREPEYRAQPQNIEAEQALLGAILVNNDAFYRVSDFLLPDHFYEPIHQRIYDQTASLIRAGKIASPITLKTFVGEMDLGGITASQYLARLAAEATTVINAQDYGRTVYDLAIRRQLIGVGEDLVNVAYDSPIDLAPREQIEEAERKLYELAEKGQFQGGFLKFADALKQSIDVAAAAYKRKGHIAGISTGLKALDEKIAGLHKSDLLVLAGRPGMGKTALATNIAFNVAKSWRGERQEDGSLKSVDGGIVGFFSLEMSAEQLAGRILAEQARVPSYKIRQGKIDEKDFVDLSDAAREMSAIPLFIDQTGGISISQLTARARRLKRQRGLDVLIIDYIQLLSGSSKKSDNRVQEITEITTGLKALAKELEICIIALSQLSRQVENREDKHPQLSDLRESGSIEQDADAVLFVFRQEYYDVMIKPDEKDRDKFVEWQSKAEKNFGVAEVIIGKQRHGPTGTVSLQFESNFTRFSDRANEDYLPDRL